MRECRRVFSRRSLLWLLVLMAAVVFFHRVDHHNAPGFAAAYRQTVAQLAASPDPSAALSQMEAESRRYMTALLWRSTDDPDLLELYRDQARQVLGDDYEAAAMAYDLSDQAQVEFTARQQAQQTLRQQLDYLAAYPGYLDTIHENAANMPTLSIFMDSSAGKFHAENVKKTDRDFPRSMDVSLTLTETAGLENFLQDGVLSVCILLWMLVTVLRLTEERRSSLRYLVFGSPRGRTWLALRRVGILGLSAALGTALLMLTGLVTDSLLYGGLGDLSAAAQSSEIFQNFPYPLTLRQVLWAYCLLKALGMWLMGLLLWLILQLIHHLQTAMVAAAAFLAVEYSLFAFVPDSYAIVALRYINVFSFVGMEKTFLHYLNINLLGRAVNGAMLCTALLPALLVLAAAGAVVYAGHHRPMAGANVLQRLAARLRPVFSRASGRLTLTGFEFRKILWYHKGLLVLLVFALWCFRAAAAPTADVSLYDTDTAAFQNEFQGPATEDTLRAIRARIAEVEGWPESEIRSAQLAALSAVEDEALKKLDTGLWVLNPAPMFTLCGGDVGGSQRIPAMAALLTAALLTAGTAAAADHAPGPPPGAPLQAGPVRPAGGGGMADPDPAAGVPGLVVLRRPDGPVRPAAQCGPFCRPGRKLHRGTVAGRMPAAAAAGAAGYRHDRVPAVEPVPDGERCRGGMLRRTGGPGGPGAGGRAGGRHPVPGPPVDPRYLLPVCLSHPPGSADSLPPSVRAAQAQGLICIKQEKSSRFEDRLDFS